MDVIALVSAVIGLILLIATVFFGNKIQNRWLRYVAVIVGIVIAVSTVENLPPFFGVTDTTTGAKAGEYLLYLGIVTAIINSLFLHGCTPSAVSPWNRIPV